jgi:hypothetical protein
LVLIKRRSVAIGVTKKLQDTYLPIPCKVIKANEYLILVESLLTKTIFARGPAELKKVKGMSIDQLSGAIDGDIAEFCSLFQILTEDNVHEEFEQLLIGPKEKTGVRTRKQLEMELAESRMDPLKLLLEEDDYIDFQD